MDKGVEIVRFLGLFGWILCSGFGTCSGFRLFGLFGRFCGKIVEKFVGKTVGKLWILLWNSTEWVGFTQFW